ncbi:MAG: hypothetical protein IJ190_10685 [Prevotella sp.]|nr:hypothetical protein [Prevotella sp.]
MSRYNTIFISVALCMTLGACIDQDGVSCEDDQQHYDLAFSVGQRQSTMRMAAQVVQASEDMADWRGIDSLLLIPFTVNHDMSRPVTGDDDAHVGGARVIFKTHITSLKKNNSQYYDYIGSNLTGTKSFLAYGKVNTLAQESDAAGRFHYGILQATNLDNGWALAGQPSAITFRLVPISQATEPDAAGQNLAYVLSQLAQVTYIGIRREDTGQLDYDGNPIYREVIEPMKSWGKAESGTRVGAMYSQLSHTTAGSSYAVQTVLAQMYHTLMTETDKTKFYASADEDYYLEDDLYSNIIDRFHLLASDGYLVLNDSELTLGEKCQGYPASLNMPDGAAYVTYDQVTETFTAGLGALVSDDNFANGYQLNNFVYPPSLYYRANSPVQVSEQQLDTYYDSEKKWDGEETGTVLSHFDRAGTDQWVRRETRSIALKTPLQYAVGRLDMTVQLSKSTLPDHAAVLCDVSAGLPVTAIYIGGQQDVNWEFKPDSRGGVVAQTIYSKMDDQDYLAKTTPSEVMRTLVLETYPNDPIWIAVEFKNTTGKDFRGINSRIVPKDGMFYLLAKLDPAEGKDANGNGVKNGSVFTQDHVTTVKFTVESLENAYLNIPDLRNAGLQVGLRANTDWQTGISKDHLIN